MANKFRLTKVLSRYKKQELLEDVPSLLGLDQSYFSGKKLQARSRKTKRELVSALVDDCLETNVSETEILDLELQCEFVCVCHCLRHNLIHIPAVYYILYLVWGTSLFWRGWYPRLILYHTTALACYKYFFKLLLLLPVHGLQTLLFCICQLLNQPKNLVWYGISQKIMFLCLTRHAHTL